MAELANDIQRANREAMAKRIQLLIMCENLEQLFQKMKQLKESRLIEQTG